MKLDKKKAQKYMERGGFGNTGSECPYCGSDDVDAEDDKGYGIPMQLFVYCNDCNATWSEHYLIIGISPDDDGDKRAVRDGFESYFPDES